MPPRPCDMTTTGEGVAAEGEGRRSSQGTVRARLPSTHSPVCVETACGPGWLKSPIVAAAAAAEKRRGHSSGSSGSSGNSRSSSFSGFEPAKMPQPVLAVKTSKQQSPLVVFVVVVDKGSGHIDAAEAGAACCADPCAAQDQQLACRHAPRQLALSVGQGRCCPGCRRGQGGRLAARVGGEEEEAPEHAAAALPGPPVAVALQRLGRGAGRVCTLAARDCQENRPHHHQGAPCAVGAVVERESLKSLQSLKLGSRRSRRKSRRRRCHFTVSLTPCYFSEVADESRFCRVHTYTERCTVDSSSTLLFA
eukprot:m.192525 g.192525  ORF g.192525 m.192525 type:complete len:307 (-) comp17586_c2_seq11:921-1841(-)